MLARLDVVAADAGAAAAELGAVVGARGTQFLVWAPMAEAVFVTGDFNDWADPGAPLTREADGHWSGFVTDARDGMQYQFRLRRGEAWRLKNDPRARAIDPETARGVLCIDRFDWGDGGAPRLPPINELVIYELHVGTFNGTGQADGTFDSVRRRLPYLKALGINAIELLPPAEFPTERSWGYNTTNPFAVEAQYGGADGLKRLVKAAHEHGIAVIVDLVLNHFGPDELDLWQFDGWSEAEGGGIYFYNDWRAETPWGANRPDYGRGEVRQYLRDAALMWLRDYRVDGLRFDATNFIRTVRGYDGDGSGELPDGWSLLQWINDEVRREFPGRLTFAEDLQRNEWLVKPVGAGGAGFDAQWDAAFVHPVRHAMIAIEDAHRDLDAIADAILHRYDGRPWSRVIYTESHDEVANGKARLPTEINPENPDDGYAQRRSTLGAALVLTSPGIPMLFKGQEFLERGWFRDDVEIDWSLLDTFKGIHRLYRDLISLRRNRAGHTRGLTGEHAEVFLRDAQNRVLGLLRRFEGGAGDDTIVIFNCSAVEHPDYRVGLPAAGTWRVRLNSGWRGYSEEFSALALLDVEAVEEPLHGFAASGRLALPGYAAVVLSQDGGGAARA